MKAKSPTFEIIPRHIALIMDGNVDAGQRLTENQELMAIVKAHNQ